MKLSLLVTQGTDPYANLALEAALLSRVGEEEVILYLWQNHRTVVIGQHQNPLREVNLARLRAEGGRLARRLSGGGAVYHDLGNLNFTFVTPKARFDLEKQTAVILKAARRMGAPAQASGRNDLTAGGRKFSGHAFYKRGEHWYHHGTLMVDTELSALSRYLNVSPEKLRAKGVASVPSRVCNLREFNPGLTPVLARQALAEAFGSVYGGALEPFQTNRLAENELAALAARYASADYLLGCQQPFDCRLARRFPWGEIQLSLCLAQGRITACQAHSDALAEEAIPQLSQRLADCPVAAEAFRQALSGWGEGEMAADVLSMLMSL